MDFVDHIILTVDYSYTCINVPDFVLFVRFVSETLCIIIMTYVLSCVAVLSDKETIVIPVIIT